MTQIRELVEIPRSGAGKDIDVLSAIRDRRSVARMRPERPPRAVIEQLLAAATWAPNHRLTEPWRFFVVTGEARHALGEVMARCQVARITDPAADRGAIYDKARHKPLRAPVVIVVAVEPATGPKVVEIEEVTAGAAAIQNLLHAAHALGLATIWRTGGACYEDAVKAFLGLQPSAYLLGFIYLGYAAMVAPPPHRTAAAALTQWIGWDDGENGSPRTLDG